MVYCALFMPRMMVGMALCPYPSVRGAFESTSLLVCLVFHLGGGTSAGRTWWSRWLLSKPVPNTLRAWWYLSPSINRLRIVWAAFYSTYAGPRMTLHALFGTLQLVYLRDLSLRNT